MTTLEIWTRVASVKDKWLNHYTLLSCLAIFFIYTDFWITNDQSVHYNKLKHSFNIARILEWIAEMNGSLRLVDRWIEDCWGGQIAEVDWLLR